MKHRKIATLTLILTLALSLFAAIPVQAATEPEIETSIQAGLAWLAAQQNPDGSWGVVNYKTADTAFCVLKFIDAAKEFGTTWDDTGYIYHQNVVDGLNYLFSRAVKVPIAVQPAGNPDSDLDGYGVTFIANTLGYETSIALMAIAATMKPAEVVNVPGSVVDGWTYEEVVEDVVDWMAWAQNEASGGSSRGGWRYSPNSGDSDNSVTGYAALGLGYAKQFGKPAPSWVLDELKLFIGAIQAPAGYSLYTPTWDYADRMLKTGNLLYEMALVGMPIEDPNVQLAIQYIEDNWGNIGNVYQRGYCLMKGLEAYDIEDLGGTDWFDDLSTWIVDTQVSDHWVGYQDDGTGVRSTAWALLTLEKVTADPDLTPVDFKQRALELVSGVESTDYRINFKNKLIISYITKSLNEQYWMDGAHLDPMMGWLVFKYEFMACNHMKILMADYPELEATYMEACELLVEADRMLAETLLNEAQALAPPVGTPARAIYDTYFAKATMYYEKGLEYMEAGDCCRAILQFEYSWLQSKTIIQRFS